MEREAYWVHRTTGQEEVYTVRLVQAARGQSGWPAYQEALARCAQIGRVLGSDYELRYRDSGVSR